MHSHFELQVFFSLIWKIEIIIQCLRAFGHITDEIIIVPPIEAIVKIKYVILSEMLKQLNEGGH